VCVEEHRKLFPSSRVTPLDMSVMAVRQQEQIDISISADSAGPKKKKKKKTDVASRLGIYVQSVFLD
jgi:hypothetical protein